MFYGTCSSQLLVGFVSQHSGFSPLREREAGAIEWVFVVLGVSTDRG
jgi:hypothetical protein